VRIKRTRNCVKQLVANVRHSNSQQSYSGHRTVCTQFSENV